MAILTLLALCACGAINGAISNSLGYLITTPSGEFNWRDLGVAAASGAAGGGLSGVLTGGLLLLQATFPPLYGLANAAGTVLSLGVERWMNGKRFFDDYGADDGWAIATSFAIGCFMGVGAQANFITAEMVNTFALDFLTEFSQNAVTNFFSWFVSFVGSSISEYITSFK